MLLAAFFLLVPALAAIGGEDLERRTLDVASSLRCPVCQNLSVADSTSEIALEMRALIADELRAGKSPDAIRASFVEKYGEWILLSPAPRGFGLLVWVLPVVASIAGAGVAAGALVRWTRRRAPPAAIPVDEARRERLRTLMTAATLPADVGTDEARTIEALSELEFDYRAGKLSPRDYEELRTLYEARAAEARDSGRARAERRIAELEARTAALLAGEVSPRPGARPRWRRWGAAGAFLAVFGVALAFVLAGAVRPRDEDRGITGDALTGTPVGTVATRDVPGLLAAGQAAIARQDLPGAAALLRRALEIDAGEPTANAYLGLILHRSGHGEQALTAFDRALARDPMSVPALWGKGLVLYETLKRPAEALHVWETLLTLKLSNEDRRHVTSLVAEARRKAPALRVSTPGSGRTPGPGPGR